MSHVKACHFSCQIVFWAFLGLSHPLVAQESLPLPDTLDMGVSSLALGGAHTATSYNQDAFLGNPAGLVFLQRKSALTGGWMRLPRAQNAWETAIVDGTRGFIGGFHFKWANAGSIRRESYTLGAAYKTKYGSVGQTVQIYKFDGVTGPGDGWHLTHSTGVLVPISYGIAFGMHGKAYLDHLENDRIPPSFHVGLLYTKDKFRASFQADRRFGFDKQDWNYSFGGDLVFMKYFGVRTGYRWDNSTGYSYYSFGASFVGPKIEAGSFYLRSIDGRASNGFGFDIALRF